MPAWLSPLTPLEELAKAGAVAPLPYSALKPPPPPIDCATIASEPIPDVRT